MKYQKIPNDYKVGGQVMTINAVERCDENRLGQCCVATGTIEIANKINKDEWQSNGCRINTFYHELTHSILETMGETELNNNEKFVCCFSSFLTEAMERAFFEVEDREEELTK